MATLTAADQVTVGFDLRFRHRLLQHSGVSGLQLFPLCTWSIGSTEKTVNALSFQSGITLGYVNLIQHALARIRAGSKLTTLNRNPSTRPSIAGVIVRPCGITMK